MIRALLLVLLAGPLITGFAAFKHYDDCWSADLAPGAEWNDLDPRYTSKALGPAGQIVRQFVIWGNDHSTSVALMSVADPIFRHPPVERFQEVAQKMIIRGQRVHGLNQCRAFEDDEATWCCLSWHVEVDGIRGRQRAYFTGRGSTKFVVLFTAFPPETFQRFGPTREWLAGMEWKGPGVFHAY